MRSMFKSSVLVAVLAGGAVLAHADRSWALSSCLIDFSNYAALKALPDNAAGNTFALSPWFTQPCSSGTFTVSESSYGHYHLSFENSCVNCFASNGYFGLNKSCAGTGSGCAVIDPAAYPRFAASHVGDQLFHVIGAPNPGMWCAGNGCIPTVGKVFKPSVIFARITPPLLVIVMSLQTTTISTPSGPQTIPIKVPVFYDNLTQQTLWLVGGTRLNADEVMITGSQGANGGPFQWDNLSFLQ